MDPKLLSHMHRRCFLERSGYGIGGMALAQLMAGILATLGRDSAHLEEVRARFARWHAHLEADGIDRTTATLVRLAADGLWLSALLGLPRLDPEIGPATIRALHDLTRP